MPLLLLMMAMVVTVYLLGLVLGAAICARWLAPRKAELGRNFAMVQRRGLEVWGWDEAVLGCRVADPEVVRSYLGTGPVH